MGNNLVIALFRHGITKENELSKYIGWLDSPLSRKGLEELQKKQLDDKPYQRVYSSDLIRAKQTTACLFPDQMYKKDRCFREMHFGDWEGKSYDQLKEEADYQTWLNDPFTQVPTNGEGFAAFAERIEKGWLMLINDSKEVDRIAIITHGGVIRYLLSKYGPGHKGFWDYSIKHGNGVHLIWEKKDCFRRRRKCTLLQEVVFTEKSYGC